MWEIQDLLVKVHIFWEGHKILRNLPLLLNVCTLFFKVNFLIRFIIEELLCCPSISPQLSQLFDLLFLIPCPIIKRQFQLNFRYCEKATKFEKITNLSLKSLSNVITKWEIFKKLCGLFRIISFLLIRTNLRINLATLRYTQSNVI